MVREEFNEPPKEEVDRVIGEVKKQMGEYYKSQPTLENVNGVMKEVAAQFGEKFEAEDPAIPEVDVIEKYEKEGWNLMDIVNNAIKLNIGSKEGKETKIVGLGDKFLVFERDERKS